MSLSLSQPKTLETKETVSVAENLTDAGKFAIAANSPAFQALLKDSKLILQQVDRRGFPEIEVSIQFPRGRADGEAIHYLTKALMTDGAIRSLDPKAVIGSVGKLTFIDSDFVNLGLQQDGQDAIGKVFDFGDRFPELVALKVTADTITLSWPGGKDSTFSEHYFKALGIKVGALTGQGSQYTDYMHRQQEELLDMTFADGASRGRFPFNGTRI